MHVIDDSGMSYSPNLHRWRGDDGSPLHLTPRLTFHRGDIGGSDMSMWRYQTVLPFADDRVSLGEGCTGLVEVDDEVPFLAKPEWLNPTASFKDRGVSTMMSAFKALGAKEVLADSSGNAGSSIAAYARAAAISATILVPASTSAKKIEQMTAFGAHVQPIEGTRDEVAQEATNRAGAIPYASHDWNPFFLEGIKTIGYEIWENLGFALPDNIVTVAGSGSIPLGLDLAFEELLSAGEIAIKPKIYIGQPEGWDPIVAAIHSRAYRPTTRARLAEGASIGAPVRGLEVARVVTASGGSGVSVTDQQIATSTRFLVSRGLFAEPTSAIAHAAYRYLGTTGAIAPTERTVVVLTGSGLKAPDAMRASLANP